jgi:hypothetical protein
MISQNHRIKSNEQGKLPLDFLWLEFFEPSPIKNVHGDAIFTFLRQKTSSGQAGYFLYAMSKALY